MKRQNKLRDIWIVRAESEKFGPLCYLVKAKSAVQAISNADCDAG